MDSASLAPNLAAARTQRAIATCPITAHINRSFGPNLSPCWSNRSRRRSEEESPTWMALTTRLPRDKFRILATERFVAPFRNALISSHSLRVRPGKTQKTQFSIPPSFRPKFVSLVRARGLSSSPTPPRHDALWKDQAQRRPPPT